MAAAALGLPLLVAYLLDRALPAQLFNSTEVLASCLFACTGLLCLVRWRLLGHAQAAYTGCCFLAFGLLTVPLPLVAVLLTDGGRVELIAPLARGAVAVCALTCAARGLRSSQVDARVRPRHLLAQTLGLSAGLYVIVAAVLVTLGHRVRTPVFLIVEAVVTLSWLAVGVLFCRRSRRGSKSPWMGFTLVPVACQELQRLLTVLRPTPWMFAAGTMLLVAAGVAIAGAASTLHFVLRDKDRSLLRLSVDLRASESRIEGERERREEQCTMFAPRWPPSAVPTAPCTSTPPASTSGPKRFLTTL